nr:phosphoribosyltransferase family protein [Kineococcus rubinsiae]
MSLDSRPPAGPAEPVWSGGWVSERLGLELTGAPGADGLDVHDLLGLALRRNPRRAHLLVSRVLGKHVPTDPQLVRAAALRLGGRVAQALGVPDAPGPTTARWRAALAGDGAAAADVLAASVRPPARPDALVIGYAETATGLGQGVADALGGPCLHSTRRAVPAAAGYAGFEEEHSHATGHQLLPTDAAVLRALADPAAPLVLVDDELSTGRTVANTLEVLHARTPRRHYVVAGLLDARGPADRARLAGLAARLGTRIDVVSLVEGSVVLPDGVLAAGSALVAAAPPAPVPRPRAVPADVEHVRPRWPAGVPLTARHGTSPAAREALVAALPGLVAEVGAAVGPGPGPVLVLGSEELLHVPQLLAVGLAGPGREVRSSSTTRSPVLAVDDPGYAVRSSVAFRSADAPVDGPGPRYAHNVSRPGGPWAVCVLVVDASCDPAALAAPDGVLAALRPLAHRLLLVTLPDDPPTTPEASP